MPSPILARADALMQRRRQSSGEGDDVPVLTDAVLVDDELPDLDARNFLPLADEAAMTPEPATQIVEDLPGPMPEDLALEAGVRDILIHEVARRVEQRLLAELPRLIESTVREFLAEQERIAALQARD